MTVANLFNVPATKEQWAIWSFSNMDHHRQIIRAIASTKGLALNEYILDPIPFYDLGVFIYNHQQMHNDMNGITGVGGFDLTNMDVNNPSQVAAFIRLHATEHLNNSTALGIG